AGVEETGDGGGGKGRTFAADRGPHAAPAQAVHHAAIRRRRILQVVVRLLDYLLVDRDAGVAAGPQRLHLRNGGPAVVLVVAVHLGCVEPAALGGLSGADVLRGPRQDVFQFFPALAVILLAIDTGEKERGEAVPVHVAAGLGGVVGITDESVAAAALHAAFH